MWLSLTSVTLCTSVPGGLVRVSLLNKQKSLKPQVKKTGQLGLTGLQNLFLSKKLIVIIWKARRSQYPNSVVGLQTMKLIDTCGSMRVQQ